MKLTTDIGTTPVDEYTEEERNDFGIPKHENPRPPRPPR